MLIRTPPFLGSDRVRSTPWLGPATGLLKTKARIARKHGRWIAVANAADKVRLDSRAREKGLIYAGVVEARHRVAVQSQRPRSDDEVSARQRSVPHCRHLGHAWCRKVLLHDFGIVRQKLWKLAGEIFAPTVSKWPISGSRPTLTGLRLRSSALTEATI